VLIDLLKLERVAMVTDGRFSGATKGRASATFRRRLLSARHSVGRGCDEILIDIPTDTLKLNVDESQLAKRKADCGNQKPTI